MVYGTTRPDELSFTLGGKTYREAAGYLASLVAYVRQQTVVHGTRLSVELVSDGLSEGDARALR